ncbi:MAG: hybrid sensor histidine kinase/response regulator [Bacteroidales bacterium]
MFFKKSIENKIRLKVVLMYLVLAIGCTLMIVYMYHLRQTMQEQKQQVATHYQTLQLTTKVLSEVNKAQIAANRKVSRSRSFQLQLDSIAILVDSLNTLENNRLNREMTSEIVSLLKEKRLIVGRLRTLFNRSNPIDPIREKLLIAQPVLEKDSVQITTVIQDTVIRQAPRRKFWKRFSDLFSPGTPSDTIIQLTTVKADTILDAQEETKAILTEVSYFAEDARHNYTQRMQDIEKQVESLLEADQAISVRLSELLIELYQGSVRATLGEIEKSEARIRSYYRYLFAGGLGMLALILIFIVLMLQDVNQGRRIRRELQRAHDRVRQLMESRHRMLLSVSHDIKTPLNSMLGYLELGALKRSIQLPEIGSMQQSGAHILGLLENLLEYAALEQGKLVLNNQVFGLQAIFKDVESMFEPLCARKGLLFTVSLDIPASVNVNSDSLKLKQILINLLSNGVKYTPAGALSLQAHYEEGLLLVKVADTGAGIPHDKIDILFRPFERIADNNTLAEGTGLGLFVVKGLLDLFGGELQVESEVGKGSCFSLKIPVAESTELKQSEPKHLLVVDDDETLLLLIGNMLKQLGHRTTVCSDLATFESLIKQNGAEFDLVLTDMEMNLFTGKDILAISKSLYPHKPVVIMTARSDYHTARAHSLGFDGYLVKPFTLETLYAQFGGNRAPDYNLSQLSALFEEDEEAIREVLDAFSHATVSHVVSLREFLRDHEFNNAQAICHKMLPMFAQLEANDVVVLLRKMDAHREHAYAGWEADLEEIIIRAEKLVTHLEIKIPVPEK